MKKLLFSWLFSVLFLSVTYAQYDDYYYDDNRTGYEGDYFSLQGALDLFKQSYSLRDFERKLNTEDNWVNNLDLDYDGRIDYIRVEHRRHGSYHAIILQALLDRYEVQDVAVIEVEVLDRRNAILQIIGDEDLYGEEVVVEAMEGYSNFRRGYHTNYGSFVNVYHWDPIQYILGPRYVVYVSPYRWQYYPNWWSPWRQCAWNVYRPRVIVYHRHYHVVRHHRVVHVHNFYREHRSYSHTVVVRTNKVRVKHGKAPIHRPIPVVQKDRQISDQSRSDNVVKQPRTSTGSRTARQNPAVSRDKNVSTSRPKTTRSNTSRADQKPRSTVTSPRTSRSTTTKDRSSVNTRTTSPSNQKGSRTSNSTTTYSRNRTSSTTSRSRTSTSSRPSNSTKPRGNSNVSSRSNQGSYSKSTRPSTTTRSRTTTTRPSSKSVKPSSPSKSKSTRSTNSSGRSTKSSSRSKGGK